MYLVILFCGLVVLTRWITKHVQGIGYLLTEDGQVALVLYFVLILPGVLLHELSHALAAWVMRVKVRHLSIGIRRKGRSNQVSLGSVDIANTGPIRASLIGLAPLIFGCAAILLISSRVLGLGELGTFNMSRFWQEIKTVYHVADFWLWAYLVLAIGNAMLPSAADRQAWGVALIFLLFAGALFYFTGLFKVYSDSIGRWVRNAGTQLTYAFAVTAAVDLIFAALLFLVEQALALIGMGRIQYR